MGVQRLHVRGDTNAAPYALQEAFPSSGNPTRATRLRPPGSWAERGGRNGCSLPRAGTRRKLGQRGRYSRQRLQRVGYGRFVTTVGAATGEVRNGFDDGHETSKQLCRRRAASRTCGSGDHVSKELCGACANGDKAAARRALRQTISELEVARALLQTGLE
jgi:hypothetical protein